VYASPAVSATQSSSPVVSLYRFGPYELDTGRGELRKFGLQLKLERKPLQVLVALLDRAGEVVTRRQLQRLLWSDGVFVDFDKGLTVAVTKLRAALSDSAENPTYIETVAGEGYRFIAKVEQLFAASTTISAAPSSVQTRMLLPISVPDEMRLSPPSVSTHPWRRKTLSAAALFACMAFLLVAGMTVLWRRPVRPGAGQAGKIMLVVLPFENLSGDPSQEYLSDGVTEELSEQLGNLHPQKLGVIGRTSAMTYKHSSRTIGQIGNELGVAYVLEGSVRREGRKLRVTAQLVQVSDQAHVWAHDYDREVRDVVQVEDEVASDIAQQVGVSIALAQPKSFYAHIPNPEAHEAYLLARYYWNKRTPEGWAMSRQYFRHAIEKDPQYSAAYAGLAESLVAKEEALAAAKKAVELDPTSGEARTALGWVEFFQDWDFLAAQDALKDAVQLDPNYAPAHHIYSGVLQVNGRLQQAISEEKQAVALDPLWLICRASLAEELSMVGQSERAVEELNQIFTIEPHYPKAHETLGTVYLRRGRYKEAIREYEASEQYGGAKPLGVVGYAYARSGDKEQALKALSQLEDLEKKSPSGGISGDLAAVEIGLGNWNAALGWLEKEYQQRDDDGLLGLKVNPIFDPLRAEPRFQELLHRMHYPQ
jgi:TolB-like protein/DNA-binding winged helix-turn-helix (wHTH) protein/Tfp pilus assembly protein PilF